MLYSRNLSVKKVNRFEIVLITSFTILLIDRRGLSKWKEVDVLNFLGATISDILTKIDDVLNKQSASLIVHVGTNDLT